MKTTTLVRTTLALAFGTYIGAFSTAGAAQAWPTSAVTIVSPYPAGGITDLLSRVVAESFAKSLGQPVVVENRTGAGGAIAMASVAKAAPDGYTLIMGGSAPTAIIPALNSNVTYKPQDFAAIGYVAGLPLVMVTHPSVPGSSLKEFIAYAKGNPDKLNCAHHGNGTGTHLACVQFDRLAGTKTVHVPYKGAPPVNSDLLANRVQVYFGTLPTQLQHIRAGKQRALGIASKERVGSAPEIPTLAEQGLKGLVMEAWNALYAPAGTPGAILERLHGELAKALARSEVRQRIEATGSIIRPGSMQDLTRLTQEEFDTARRLGESAGIKLD